MKEIVTRIELLLLAMVVVASSLLIPAVKPSLDVRRASVDVFDAVIRLKVDCSADIQKAAPRLAQNGVVLERYQTRLYSEEAAANTAERWSLINVISTSVVLEVQAKVQPTWIGFHDLWIDNKETATKCRSWFILSRRM